jgi:hypothetical protein
MGRGMMMSITGAVCAALCLCWGAFAGEDAWAEAKSKPEAAAALLDTLHPEVDNRANDYGTCRSLHATR